MTSTAIQKLDFSLPIGSIDAYIYRVNQIPMLSAEEEYDLAQRFRQRSDLEAARQLVMSHLRFVARIARNYLGYGLPQADLIQEGNIGLMKAVKRFDPEMGVRLVSFAVHWIKAEIHEFILRNWRIVKVATTKAQRKLFFNLRKASKRLGWFSNEEIEAVAKDLNVSAAEVRNMEARLNARDESLHYTFEEDSEQPWTAPIHYLTADVNFEPGNQLETHEWSDHREQHLQSALEHLDERSKDILKQRWLLENKATLHELADKYGVSAERIRQLEKNAMDKLKNALSQLA